MDKGQWTVDNERRIVLLDLSLSVFNYPLSIAPRALL